MLVVLIEATSADPTGDFATLLNELKSHSATLGRKRKLVALTKMDLIDPDGQRRFKKVKFGRGVKVQPISAVAHMGLQEFLDAVWSMVARGR